MSDRVPSPAQPGEAAFQELQYLVRNLVDELAGFRRRALAAEARLRELEPPSSAGNGASGSGASPAASAGRTARLAELEQENAVLRARLDSAAERTRRMLDRVRFLRQQHGAGAER